MCWLRFMLLPILLTAATAATPQDTASTKRDTLDFQGQASLWSILNIGDGIDGLQLGGRYLPSLYAGHRLGERSLLDAELSADLIAWYNPISPDSSDWYDDARLYRAWVRCSGRQWEVRIGLQKLNFGTATLLRPLMWFDQMDPRDPLRLSPGVWGVLTRYYFLNNSTLWAWSLLGNKEARVFDIGRTTGWIPEFGGRFQHPLGKGEMALTFHHRQADTRGISPLLPEFSKVPEQRFGFDMKQDFRFGLNLEAAWIHKRRDLGSFTNQQMINLGIDYTFGIGNGLNVIVEQVALANDSLAFRFSDPNHFSGLSLSYPLGISDNLNAIVFYSWKQGKSYNFISWNHRFRSINIHVMAFINPEQYLMPQQPGGSTFFAGKGFQCMIVYNH